MYIRALSLVLRQIKIQIYSLTFNLRVGLHNSSYYFFFGAMLNLNLGYLLFSYGI
jgi:hypothetical protein